MSIVSILLIVSLLGFVVLSIMIKLNERWSKLPHFVKNSVGAVTAICSITDFKKALANGSTIGENLILVPQSMIHSDLPDKQKYLVKESESLEYYKHWYRRNIIDPALFVPFTSERFKTYAEQEELFERFESPSAFIDQKFRENRENDYRLRFVAWTNNDLDLEFWRVIVAIIGVLMFLLFSLSYFSDYSNVPITTYTTDVNGVHEIVTSREESRKLLMSQTEGPFFYHISHGKVSEIQVLGEGVVRACVETSSKIKRICGSAPANVHEGDEAFVRHGTMLLWSIKDNPYTGNGVDNWLISQEEAYALVATGKFKIVY